MNGQTLERRYSKELNQERQRVRATGLKSKIVGKVSSLVAQKMAKAVQDKESWVWPFAFSLAILNDFSDILMIGALPIIGDISDLVTGLLLTAFLFNIGGKIRIKIRIIILIATALELTSLSFIGFIIDFLTLWTFAILWAWYMVNKRGKLAEEGLETIKKGGTNQEVISEFS